jgi:predicted AAA+ superfamily ATPase
LLAFEKEGLVDEIKAYAADARAMTKPLHDMALKLYRTYLCSGGMPEAVAQMAAVEGDVLRFDEAILSDIIAAYLSDMGKYIATPMEKARIEAIYRSIPRQLGNRSSKFQYAKINKSARARDYESALDWLLASNMVIKSDLAQTPRMPLKSHVEDGFFKLYLSDVGLLRHLLEIDCASIMLDRDFNAKGLLTENYVATELTLSGIPLYYWRDAHSAEVDFLMQDYDASILPVEVKSGVNKKMSSMKAYIEKYRPQSSIRLLQSNFGATHDILTIPLYAAFCLEETRDKS